MKNNANKNQRGLLFDIVISLVRSTHVLAAPAFRIVARSERVGVGIKYPYRKSGLRNCIATNRVATAAAAALYSRAPGERAVSLSSMSDANILVYSARAISPARRRESRRRMHSFHFSANSCPMLRRSTRAFSVHPISPHVDSMRRKSRVGRARQKPT